MTDTTMAQAVLVNDTSSLNHHGCNIVVEEIRRNAAMAGIQVVHTVKLHEDWQQARHVERIRGSDLVIVNGEGTLHDSRPRAVRLALCASFCRQHGIVPVLINSVYQRNDALIAKHVTSFERVFVRESNSQHELARVGIQSRVVPDMTFALQWPLEHTDRKTERIVYSDSVLPDVARELCLRYQATRGSVFITLQCRPPKREQEKTAISVMARWAVNLGRHVPLEWLTTASAPWTERWDTREDLLATVAASRLIVTGRFHLVCLALLARTPFVAVESNTFKIGGLLQDVGLSHRLLRTDRLDDSLLDYASWQKDELERIALYTEEARRRIEEMFREVRGISGPA